MGMITGFIEGLLLYDVAGDLQALPFQDKIEGASFKYATESLFVETFGQDGMKGASEACPFRHDCSIELRSKNLAWSLLQAATNTIARAAQVGVRTQFSQVLTASDITAGTANLEVTWAPAVGSAVVVSDIDGINYAAVYTTGTPNTLEIAGVTAGLKVTVSYVLPPIGANNEIALGSGSKLGEVGLYGRFFGCPDTLIVQINRAIIDANLDLSVETDSASASLMARALRDADGNFATIRRLS